MHQPEFHLYKVTVHVVLARTRGEGGTPQSTIDARRLYVVVPGEMMFGVSDAVLRNPPKDDDGRAYDIVKIDEIENLGPVLVEGSPCSSVDCSPAEENPDAASRSKSGKENT